MLSKIGNAPNNLRLAEIILMSKILRIRLMFVCEVQRLVLFVPRSAVFEIKVAYNQKCTECPHIDLEHLTVYPMYLPCGRVPPPPPLWI